MFKIRLLVLMFLFATTVFAVVRENISLQEVSKRAGLIVAGRVIDQHSAWDADGKEIYTYTILEITEVIKGEAGGKEITLRHLGGRVGIYESQVEGMPSFEPGNDVFVFLGKYQAQPYYGVIDIKYGKYRVDRNMIFGADARSGINLESFVQQIESYLK